MTNTKNESLGRYTVSLTRVRDNYVMQWTEDFTVHAGSRDMWPGLNDWESTVRFLWEDGNYSCNCNRFLFFERAMGRTEAEIEELDPNKGDDWGDCGKYEKYRCNWIKNADTNEIIYSGDSVEF